MKNILVVLLLSLITSVASAQFMVTSMISSPADGEEMSLDNLTDNIGVLYSMEKISAGIMMNGDNYNLVARYAFGDHLYAYGLMTEEEEVSLGVGYALNIWNNLYIEPSYMYNMSDDAEMCDDEGMGKMIEEDKGELKLSLTYKF
jgi:hypothetical protein